MRTIAIIGCGKVVEGKVGWAIGHVHASGWMHLGEPVNLVGVDVSSENLRHFAEVFDVPDSNLFLSTDAMYETVTPDVVSICTWPGLHCNMTIEAAEKGVKGIVCEKPMALTSGDIRKMTEVCALKGVYLAIAHQRRYKRAFQRMRDIVKSGTIGDHCVFEAWTGDNWDILSMTTHWFDLANFVFDCGPTWILSGCSHSGQIRYSHRVEDDSVILAEYPNHQSALFITGPDFGHNYNISVRGSEGMIRYANDNKPLEVFSREKGFQQFLLEGEQEFYDDFSSMFRNLVNCIDGVSDELLCGVEKCGVATEMALAAHESAVENKKITMPIGFDYFPLNKVET